MTEIQDPHGESVSLFYDRLAPEYDLMTGFEKRFVLEKPFFRMLVKRYKIRTALDAGSGTGFHSLLLAQLGVRVTAIDISQEMLNRLRAHAREMGLDIETVKSAFGELGKVIDTKVDAVISMGNTLAHLLSPDDLRQALENFSSVLATNGVLIIQNLNYDRILSRRERIQSIKEEQGVVFVRFYDYEGDRIRFNLLKLDRTQTEIMPSLNSVELRPLLKEDLLRDLTGAGFSEVSMFGSISMEEFQPADSKDLVVLARKP